MGLGRGLLSLIPKRDSGYANDVLDQIDSMEEVNEAPVAPRGAAQDFRELESDDDAFEIPAKPLVTPIYLDPQNSVQNVRVKSETEDDDVDDEELEEDQAQPTPEERPIIAELKEPAKVSASALYSGAEEYEGLWDRHEEAIAHIIIGDITINPLQPRRTFGSNELVDLQESIARNGILQPLVVRRLNTGKFELIAGERRLRAAKALKWDKVPCVVRKDVKSDQSRLVFALVENIQRENLNPIEEALAYKQLNEDYGLTHEEIGQKVGKSRVGVTNIVRVLQLPAEIQRGMIEGKITMGHAKAILMIPDSEKQIRFYHHLVDEGLTVRKAELRARRIQRTMITGVSTPRNRLKDRHPLSLKYTPMIEERFGYSTHIRFEESNNAFEVVLKATNEQDLEELVGRLIGTKELPATDLDRDVIDD